MTKKHTAEQKLAWIKLILDVRIKSAQKSIKNMEWHNICGPPLVSEYKQLELCRRLLEIVNLE